MQVKGPSWRPDRVRLGCPAMFDKCQRALTEQDCLSARCFPGQTGRVQPLRSSPFAELQWQQGGFAFTPEGHLRLWDNAALKHDQTCVPNAEVMQPSGIGDASNSNSDLNVGELENEQVEQLQAIAPQALPPCRIITEESLASSFLHNCAALCVRRVEYTYGPRCSCSIESVVRAQFAMGFNFKA